MNNILILTIGQRDLQLVTRNEYYEIEKKDMKFTQDKLGELLESNQLEWLPISLVKKEAREKGKKEDIDINKFAIKQITFPIIENLFMYLKKNEIKIDKIYLFYTNRQHYRGEIDYKFIMGEPYLTNKVFNYFYSDILKHYDLGKLNIEYLNIGEKIDNINYHKLYPFFDIFFKKLNTEKIDNIYTATAGGIPIIKNVIEDLTTLSYPNNSTIFEQNNKDDISLSKFHQYKNYYRNYNLLSDSIKRWDFAKALDIYQAVSSDSNNLLNKILYITNNIFFIAEEKGKNNLENLLKIKGLSKTYQEKFEKINNILHDSRENASFMIFLKFLQVYKQGNYWAATTILITLFETFIEETLAFNYPDSVIIENRYNHTIYKFFNWEKINPNWDFTKVRKKDIFKKDNNKILRNNWASIEEIILRILPNNKKNIFGFIKNNLLNNAKNFKTNRNNFVHHGISIVKSDIDNLLKIDKSNSDFLGSSILNEIFRELKTHNPEYFNWLKFFEEVLLEEIKTITPNIK